MKTRHRFDHQLAKSDIDCSVCGCPDPSHNGDLCECCMAPCWEIAEAREFVRNNPDRRTAEAAFHLPRWELWWFGYRSIWTCRLFHRRWRYDHGTFGGCVRCRRSWYDEEAS